MEPSIECFKDVREWGENSGESAAFNELIRKHGKDDVRAALHAMIAGG